jgi:hypothetical protein
MYSASVATHQTQTLAFRLALLVEEAPCYLPAFLEEEPLDSTASSRRQRLAYLVTLARQTVTNLTQGTAPLPLLQQPVTFQQEEYTAPDLVEAWAEYNRQISMHLSLAGTAAKSFWELVGRPRFAKVYLRMVEQQLKFIL